MGVHYKNVDVELYFKRLTPEADRRHYCTWKLVKHVEKDVCCDRRITSRTRSTPPKLRHALVFRRGNCLNLPDLTF